MKPAEDRMEAAERGVALEALRAGREREFETLVPYLHREPGEVEMAALAQSLPWSGAGLERALASLRRRVREVAMEAGP